MVKLFKRRNLGQTLDQIIFILGGGILVWLLLAQLLGSIYYGLVFTLGIMAVIRLPIQQPRLNKVVKVHKKLRLRQQIARKLASYTPEDLVDKVCLALQGAQEQEKIEVIRLKDCLWAQYYLKLTRKKIGLAIAHFPEKHIGVEQIQAFQEYLAEHNFAEGFYITTGELRRGAMRRTAQYQHLHLVNGSGLSSWLANQIPSEKSSPKRESEGLAADKIKGELLSFTHKKVIRFFLTAVIMVLAYRLTAGKMGYYFLTVAGLNLILAGLGIWQGNKQTNLAIKGLKKLQTEAK